jgi:hypothetical protein
VMGASEREEVPRDDETTLSRAARSPPERAVRFQCEAQVA